MTIEKGRIEIRLSTYEHKVHVHNVKLVVIKSARNRFVGDFESLSAALDYANEKNIEVIEIKNI